MSNLTALYAQTSDTLKPGQFTRQERERIAERVVRANECDSLLTLTETELSLADSIIAAKDSVNFQLQTISFAKDTIIDGLYDETIGLREDLSKRTRKTKWIKVGWLSTTVGLLATIVYVATH